MADHVHDDPILVDLRVDNSTTLSRRVLNGYPTKSTMENTLLIVEHAVTFSKLDFLTQNLSTLDIQRVLLSKSDSACRETPKTVELSFITY